MIGLGIGIPYTRTTSGPTLGTTIATAHYNRVIADGGVLPAGISGLGSVLDSVISAYSITDSTDFNTKVPVFLDPQYTGYKLGAGSGTTLGQAARTVYAISSSADVTQTTAASQPLLLAHSGLNYWWGSGVAGNYCSTPNASANQITGDIEFAAYVNFQDISNQDTIFIKSDAVAGTSYCYSFWKNGDDLALTYSNGGTVALRVTTTSSARLSSVYTYGTDIWVKGNRSATTGDVKFYYGSNGTTWTQLGTTQSTTAQTIYNASIPLWVGDWANILFQFRGKIYRATISDTIGGAPVVDFNPSQYSASSSQTNWNSSTGEVWSINVDSGNTGYKGVLVNRTIMQGDGIDDYIFSSSFVLPTVKTLYIGGAIYNVGNSYPKPFFDSYNQSNQNYEGVDAANTYFSYQAGTGINISSSSQNNIFAVYNSVRNGASSSIQINNGTATNGTTGTGPSVTGFVLMGYRTIGTSANLCLNTFNLANSADNSTVKTAMYNVVKTMNKL